MKLPTERLKVNEQFYKQADTGPDFKNIKYSFERKIT